MAARQPASPSRALYELIAGGRPREAEDAIAKLAQGRRLGDVIVGLIEPLLYQIGADVALDVVGPEVEMAAIAVARSSLATLAGRGPWKTQTGRRAITALVPGEEHDLGLEMVSTLLVREGWSVCRAPRPCDATALVGTVATAAPDLVCLSVTTPAMLPAAADIVRAIHDTAPRTRVMVGGLAFRMVPERAIRVGADLFAEDARAAIDAVRGTFG